MKKPILILLGLSLLVGCVIAYQNWQADSPNQAVSSFATDVRTKRTQAETSPSPIPFQEMTIPYLQSRQYQSQVGERSVFQNTGSFTSYQTSYLSDGLEINGLLYIPKGTAPAAGWPAVVFLHGYIPPAEYQTTDNYNSYAAALAEQGIVVFKIDLRGHGNSEGSASGAYYAGDYVIDTLNAAAALENLPEVDPEKIGLWGHSMAGNIVLRSIAAKPSLDAGVIWAGAVYTYEDFREYGISDSSYQRPPDDSQRSQERSQLRALYGEFNPDDPFWQQVPATNYLDGVNTPIQIHHAVNDSVVTIEYSRNLDQILDQTEIPHRLYEYQSGGHNITGSSFTAAMQRSGSFFKEPSSEL